MTTEKKEIFAGVVKEMSKAEGGWTLYLGIPALDKNYPTKTYKVPEEQAAKLKIGSAYNFILTKGGLKKNKDGSWPNHFFWNYRGLEGPSTEEPKAAEASATRESPAVAPQKIIDSQDSRERSIERQVALKEARLAADFFISHLDTEALKAAQGDSLAELQDFYLGILSGFYKKMVGLLQSQETPPEAPASASVPPRTAGAPTEAAMPSQGPVVPSGVPTHPPAEGIGAAPKNLGELFTLALKHYKLSRQQSFEILGITRAEEIADIPGAWKLIEAAMGKR